MKEHIISKIDLALAGGIEHDRRVEAVVAQIHSTDSEIRDNLRVLKVVVITSAAVGTLVVLLGVFGFNSLIM